MVTGRRDAGRTPNQRSEHDQPAGVALWGRPTWSADRFVRDFFGPAAASDWIKPLDQAAAFQPGRRGDQGRRRRRDPPRTAGRRREQDVNVDVEDGRLVIHGERRDEFDAKPAEDTESGVKATRVLHEVRYGAFAVRSRFPSTSPVTTMSASYHAGVLSVRVSGRTGSRSCPARGASRSKPTDRHPETSGGHLAHRTFSIFRKAGDGPGTGIGSGPGATV